MFNCIGICVKNRKLDYHFLIASKIRFLSLAWAFCIAFSNFKFSLCICVKSGRGVLSIYERGFVGFLCSLKYSFVIVRISFLLTLYYTIIRLKIQSLDKTISRILRAFLAPLPSGWLLKNTWTWRPWLAACWMTGANSESSSSL